MTQLAKCPVPSVLPTQVFTRTTLTTDLERESIGGNPEPEASSVVRMRKGMHRTTVGRDMAAVVLTVLQMVMEAIVVQLVVQSFMLPRRERVAMDFAVIQLAVKLVMVQMIVQLPMASPGMSVVFPPMVRPSGLRHGADDQASDQYQSRQCCVFEHD